MVFIEKIHKNPTRHRLEEHDILNWMKPNRTIKESFLEDSKGLLCYIGVN